MITRAIHFPHLELTTYIKNNIGLLLFLIIKIFKSQNRNRLISVEDELRVCLSKLDPELSIFAAKNKHRFHIKEINSIFYSSIKNNTVLDDIYVHIAFSYLMVFSNLIIQNCQ
jgi:hypothetical protein